MIKFYSWVQEKKYITLAIFICFAFFLAYSLLTVVRHNHFNSFGYDLGINDQVVWRYSTFQLPYTTSDPYPDQTKLVAHIELTYALLAPFYWIWSDARMLLILEAGFVCFSALGIYLTAKRHTLHDWICLALVVSYLGFYGVQNALWADAHSATFATAYLSWFIYFVDSRKYKYATIFLVLSILTKENIALLTFLTSLSFFITTKQKILLGYMTISLTYLLFVYLIFFPFVTPDQYLYQNEAGLFSNIHPVSLFDTSEKRDAILYSFLSFGFLPILAPTYLFAVFGDFATYFILASDLTASHGIFMHYRVTLTPLLSLSTVMAIKKFRFLNRKIFAIYLLICVLVIQYVLHLPLSYLSKQWFWITTSGVENIQKILNELPPNASVVSQNNIIPHISHRDEIYTLYPERKKFSTNSPCGQEECNWFRWFNKPTYLVVDTSPEWDARHLLTNREEYINGLQNLQTAGVIKKYKVFDSAIIYQVLIPPN